RRRAHVLPGVHGRGSPRPVLRDPRHRASPARGARAVKVLRPIAILAVIVGAIFVGMRYTAHHEGKIFMTLYMHLMPAPLVQPAPEHMEHAAHAEPLLRIPLPSSLAAFDMDRTGHGPYLVATN